MTIPEVVVVNRRMELTADNKEKVAHFLCDGIGYSRENVRPFRPIPKLR